MGGGLTKGAALSSETEADKAFKAIDSNGDGMLSADEIKAAIAKHGKLCKAKWSDAKITETICKFDIEYAALRFEPGPAAQSLSRVRDLVAAATASCAEMSFWQCSPISRIRAAGASLRHPATHLPLGPTSCRMHAARLESVPHPRHRTLTLTLTLALIRGGGTGCAKKPLLSRTGAMLSGAARGGHRGRATVS